MEKDTTIRWRSMTARAIPTHEPGVVWATALQSVFGGRRLCLDGGASSYQLSGLAAAGLKSKSTSRAERHSPPVSSPQVGPRPRGWRPA